MSNAVDRKAVYPWFNLTKWRNITKIIKQRDDYTCMNCGSLGDELNNKLTVDHIKPLALFDEYDIETELAYNPDNLVTLCNYCNGKKQDRINVRQNYTNTKWFG